MSNLPCFSYRQWHQSYVLGWHPIAPPLHESDWSTKTLREGTCGMALNQCQLSQLSHILLFTLFFFRWTPRPLTCLPRWLCNEIIVRGTTWYVIAKAPHLRMIATILAWPCRMSSIWRAYSCSLSVTWTQSVHTVQHLIELMSITRILQSVGQNFLIAVIMATSLSTPFLLHPITFEHCSPVLILMQNSFANTFDNTTVHLPLHPLL